MPARVCEGVESGASSECPNGERCICKEYLKVTKFCHQNGGKKQIFEIDIPGMPIAKQRPRLTNWGKAYDPQYRTKLRVKAMVRREFEPLGYSQPFDGEIWVHMDFHTRMPTTWSKKRKKEVLGNGDIRRPDLDNYVKFYCDVMNEIVYRDDSCITRLTCEKRYSYEPRVKITIVCHTDEASNGTEEAPEPERGAKRSR